MGLGGSQRVDPAAAGLRALETGMEGGKWFRLIDKVWTEKNLQSALREVLENGGSAGVDGRSVVAVEGRERRGNLYHPETTKSREL